MAPRVALVLCVHHKPWLVMGTLITALLQDHQDLDFHFIYNVGSGDRLSSDATGRNGQLSPFDERVREVCRLSRKRVFEVEFENDEALDSGAWYKFIRTNRWRAYDWVLFVGEGTLFARRTLLSAMLDLVRRNPQVHVVASGHEKRRIPKDLFLAYRTRYPDHSEVDVLHDRMIKETFDVFCRDPAFRQVFEAWRSDFRPETQCHVPEAGPPSALWRRVRAAWVRRHGSPADGGVIAQLPWILEYAAARARLLSAVSTPSYDEGGRLYVNGVMRFASDVAEVEPVQNVAFHRVDGPEWFGCATNHLMSRSFLETFSRKLDEFGMYDAIELPFAGTALEVIWGFIPAWLGFEKWFTDGLHRVRKDFVTYRREDYPPEMATYINRYHPGRIAVSWSGDYLKVRAVAKELSRLRIELPVEYF